MGDGGETPDNAVPQWDWPLPDAAREVLVYGTIDWIELGQIHWRCQEVSPDEPSDGAAAADSRADRRPRSWRASRDLAPSAGDAPGFVAWDCSLDDALSRIRSVYVDDYDDMDVWDWFCLLELTSRGELLARAIEARGQPSAARRPRTAGACPQSPSARLAPVVEGDASLRRLNRAPLR